jgi:hypothetical protein
LLHQESFNIILVNNPCYRHRAAGEKEALKQKASYVLCKNSKHRKGDLLEEKGSKKQLGKIMMSLGTEGTTALLLLPSTLDESAHNGK